jgi:acyl-CoA reductase-like NAD-dependent aldehyde dehydrogenase
VAETFTNKFLALTSQLQFGDPLMESTDIGPIINEQQAVRIETWIQEAVDSGAQILTGGKRVGTFIPPTVITNADPNCKIMCEEVFGPVINILIYDELEKLIDNVNNSKYGLQAGIFTSNLNTAFFLARECDFGGININNASSSRADTMPYGGVKSSGIGREGPKFAIEDMTEIKVITFNTKDL